MKSPMGRWRSREEVAVSKASQALTRELKLCSVTETEPLALLGICPPSSCTPFSRSSSKAAFLVSQLEPFSPRPREQRSPLASHQQAAAGTASNRLFPLVEPKGLMEEYEAATDEAPTESCQSGQAAERKMKATAAHRKSRVSWEMGARAKGSRASARKRPLKNSTRCQTCRNISAPGEASCWHEAALLLQEPPRECRRCNVSFRGETMVAGMMSAGDPWSRGWSLQCMHLWSE